MPGLADLGEPSATLRDWTGFAAGQATPEPDRGDRPIFEELVERQNDGGWFNAVLADVDAKHGATMGDEVFRAISCGARTEWNR